MGRRKLFWSCRWISCLKELLRVNGYCSTLLEWFVQAHFPCITQDRSFNALFFCLFGLFAAVLPTLHDMKSPCENNCWTCTPCMLHLLSRQETPKSCCQQVMRVFPSICRFPSSTLIMLCILYPNNPLREASFLSSSHSLLLAIEFSN